MSEVVTAWDALDRFRASAKGRNEFYRWCTDPRRRQVVPRVMEHKAKVVNTVAVAQVIDVAERTTHPLEDIDGDEVKKVERIRDWHTSFAAMQVLHFVTEHIGHLPTWEEFRQEVQRDPYREMWWEPARAARDQVAQRPGISLHLATQAVKWRVGLFYYAFLKEQYVLAVLRKAGLEVQQHVLADALFKVDGWVGRVNIDMFIGNEHFRLDRDAEVAQTKDGRKTKSADLLDDAIPEFEGLSMQFAVQHEHGVLHLPPETALKEAAEFTRRWMG
jgi:hypothetical protein